MSIPKPSEQTTPLLIIITGPSGVGKDSIISRMRENGESYFFTVTATTRTQRPTELNGVDYIFVSEQDFQQMIESGELLEWAKVYGHFYGVPKTHIVNALDNGTDVVIKTDVQGASSIKKLVPEAISIFISTPSIEELEYRLSLRKTESSKALRLRLQTAVEEINIASTFDHIVINHRDKLEDTLKEIETVIKWEKRNHHRGKISL